MHQNRALQSARRTALAIALVAIALALPSSARALNVGYYEMCFGEGQPPQANAITNAGHTAVNLTDLTAADLAPVDVIMVNNCENLFYAQEYLDRLNDIADAVAAGKILVLHDRYVDIAETILPGGSTFDIQRYATFPDPNNESKDINVLDPSSPIVAGPAGTINDTTLDGGNYSNHGFAVVGSLPGTAALVLSTNDPTHIVTFLYTYGAGAVMYSSIPLDFYLGGSTPFATMYALNVVDYAAYLTTSCGDGVTDPGEDCDLGGANGTSGTCCTAGCGFAPVATACRGSVDACDAAESCSGVSGLCPADALVPAGEPCRAASGECDAEEVCDGSTAQCPGDAQEPAGTSCGDDGNLCTKDECNGLGSCEHPGKPDADFDGTCDEQDACTNIAVSLGRGTNVTFSKLDTPPGDDVLSANWVMEFLPPTPTIDPLANGIRIVLYNEDADAAIVDATIPGGAYSKVTKVGWSVSRTGTFTYRDRTTTPTAGITTISVKKMSSGRTKVSVRGKKSNYDVPITDHAIRQTIVLDPPTAETGQCGDALYSACIFNRLGSKLSCK